ncbi:AAA family ATPase [Marinivivus vitaminiproducens]|uniref:AAA family ATPase n=1 Tax=Marinivivus vitaminiproducens TaxID=3035935 RepID=UPI0027AB58D0|nr:AAA family ATPase [Geminicoccaceae bacterium SCSIO 64248]
MAAVIGRERTQGRSKAERQLRAFARRIDPILRPAYAHRVLAKLVLPPFWRRYFTQDSQFHSDKPAPVAAAGSGRPPLMWLPSLASAMAWVIASQVVNSFWPGQVTIWLMACLTAALITEFWLWPTVLLLGFNLRLMQTQASGPTSGRYLAARVGRSSSGFDIINGPSIGTSAPGDLVVGVFRRFGPMVALVHLTAEGRQAVTSFPHRVQVKDALPRPRRAVRRLAEQFDEQCTTWRRIGQTRSAPTPLRSGSAGGGDPWASVVIEADVQTELDGLAEAFSEGRSTASGGLLLHGPPGTGKTLIARALAARIGCAFYPISLPDLKAEWTGMSGQRTRELWQRALNEPRAVLFVDECDGLFSRRTMRPDSFLQEILTTFLSEWDGFGKQGTVWVVGATNRRDTIDPAILSRFGEEVEIGLPSASSRETILRRELTTRGYQAPLPDRSAELTTGMAGRDLSSLAGRLMRAIGEDGAITPELLTKHTARWRKQGSTVVDIKASWDRLVLAEDTLSELQSVAGMLQHAAALTARGVDLPRGLMLSGPPGTGKTQIARTIAQESGLHFIAGSTAELKAGVVGQSGERVRDLFTRAREAAPAILFIDELDILAPVRGGLTVDSAVGEIVGQLLQEMDGVTANAGHVFVLAASNRPEVIDPAIRSRFTRTITVPLPSEDERRRIVLALLRDKPLDGDAEALASQLAHESPDASGRDLRGLIGQAEQRAVMRALAAGQPETVTLRPEDFAKGEAR